MDITVISGIDFQTGLPRICDIEIKYLDLKNHSEVEKVLSSIRNLAEIHQKKLILEEADKETNPSLHDEQA